MKKVRNFFEDLRLSRLFHLSKNIFLVLKNKLLLNCKLDQYKFTSLLFKDGHNHKISDIQMGSILDNYKFFSSERVDLMLKVPGFLSTVSGFSNIRGNKDVEKEDIDRLLDCLVKYQEWVKVIVDSVVWCDDDGECVPCGFGKLPLNVFRDDKGRLIYMSKSTGEGGISFDFEGLSSVGGFTDVKFNTFVLSLVGKEREISEDVLNKFLYDRAVLVKLARDMLEDYSELCDSYVISLPFVFLTVKNFVKNLAIRGNSNWVNNVNFSDDNGQENVFVSGIKDFIVSLKSKGVLSGDGLKYLESKYSNVFTEKGFVDLLSKTVFNDVDDSFFSLIANLIGFVDCRVGSDEKKLKLISLSWFFDLIKSVDSVYNRGGLSDKWFDDLLFFSMYDALNKCFEGEKKLTSAFLNNICKFLMGDSEGSFGRFLYKFLDFFGITKTSFFYSIRSRYLSEYVCVNYGISSRDSTWLQEISSFCKNFAYSLNQLSKGCVSCISLLDKYGNSISELENLYTSYIEDSKLLGEVLSKGVCVNKSLNDEEILKLLEESKSLESLKDKGLVDNSDFYYSPLVRLISLLIAWKSGCGEENSSVGKSMVALLDDLLRHSLIIGANLSSSRVKELNEHELLDKIQEVVSSPDRRKEFVSIFGLIMDSGLDSDVFNDNDTVLPALMTSIVGASVRAQTELKFCNSIVLKEFVSFKRRQEYVVKEVLDSIKFTDNEQGRGSGLDFDSDIEDFRNNAESHLLGYKWDDHYRIVGSNKEESVRAVVDSAGKVVSNYYMTPNYSLTYDASRFMKYYGNVKYDFDFNKLYSYSKLFLDREILLGDNVFLVDVARFGSDIVELPGCGVLSRPSYMEYGLKSAMKYGSADLSNKELREKMFGSYRSECSVVHSDFVKAQEKGWAHSRCGEFVVRNYYCVERKGDLEKSVVELMKQDVSSGKEEVDPDEWVLDKEVANMDLDGKDKPLNLYSAFLSSTSFRDNVLSSSGNSSLPSSGNAQYRSDCNVDFGAGDNVSSSRSYSCNSNPVYPYVGFDEKKSSTFSQGLGSIKSVNDCYWYMTYMTRFKFLNKEMTEFDIVSYIKNCSNKKRGDVNNNNVSSNRKEVGESPVYSRTRYGLDEGGYASDHANLGIDEGREKFGFFDCGISNSQKDDVVGWFASQLEVIGELKIISALSIFENLRSIIYDVVGSLNAKTVLERVGSNLGVASRQKLVSQYKQKGIIKRGQGGRRGEDRWVFSPEYSKRIMHEVMRKGLGMESEKRITNEDRIAGGIVDYCFSRVAELTDSSVYFRFARDLQNEVDSIKLLVSVDCVNNYLQYKKLFKLLDGWKSKFNEQISLFDSKLRSFFVSSGKKPSKSGIDNMSFDYFKLWSELSKEVDKYVNSDTGKRESTFCSRGSGMVYGSFLNVMKEYRDMLSYYKSSDGTFLDFFVKKMISHYSVGLYGKDLVNNNDGKILDVLLVFSDGSKELKERDDSVVQIGSEFDLSLEDVLNVSDGYKDVCQVSVAGASDDELPRLFLTRWDHNRVDCNNEMVPGPLRDSFIGPGGSSNSFTLYSGADLMKAGIQYLRLGDSNAYVPMYYGGRFVDIFDFLFPYRFFSLSGEMLENYRSEKLELGWNLMNSGVKSNYDVPDGSLLRSKYGCLLTFDPDWADVTTMNRFYQIDELVYADPFKFAMFLLFATSYAVPKSNNNRNNNNTDGGFLGVYNDSNIAVFSGERGRYGLMSFDFGDALKREFAERGLLAVPYSGNSPQRKIISSSSFPWCEGEDNCNLVIFNWNYLFSQVFGRRFYDGEMANYNFDKSWFREFVNSVCSKYGSFEKWLSDFVVWLPNLSGTKSKMFRLSSILDLFSHDLSGSMYRLGFTQDNLRVVLPVYDSRIRDLALKYVKSPEISRIIQHSDRYKMSCFHFASDDRMLMNILDSCLKDKGCPKNKKYLSSNINFNKFFSELESNGLLFNFYKTVISRYGSAWAYRSHIVDLSFKCKAIFGLSCLQNLVLSDAPANKVLSSPSTLREIMTYRVNFISSIVASFDALVFSLRGMHTMFTNYFLNRSLDVNYKAKYNKSGKLVNVVFQDSLDSYFGVGVGYKFFVYFYCAFSPTSEADYVRENMLKGVKPGSFVDHYSRIVFHLWKYPELRNELLVFKKHGKYAEDFLGQMLKVVYGFSNLSKNWDDNRLLDNMSDVWFNAVETNLLRNKFSEVLAGYYNLFFSSNVSVGMREFLNDFMFTLSTVGELFFSIWDYSHPGIWLNDIFPYVFESYKGIRDEFLSQCRVVDKILGKEELNTNLLSITELSEAMGSGLDLGFRKFYESAVRLLFGNAEMGRYTDTVLNACLEEIGERNDEDSKKLLNSGLRHLRDSVSCYSIDYMNWIKGHVSCMKAIISENSVLWLESKSGESHCFIPTNLKEVVLNKDPKELVMRLEFKKSSVVGRRISFSDVFAYFEEFFDLMFSKRLFSTKFSHRSFKYMFGLSERAYELFVSMVAYKVEKYGDEDGTLSRSYMDNSSLTYRDFFKGSSYLLSSVGKDFILLEDKKKKCVMSILVDDAQFGKIPLKTDGGYYHVYRPELVCRLPDVESEYGISTTGEARTFYDKVKPVADLYDFGYGSYWAAKLYKGLGFMPVGFCKYFDVNYRDSKFNGEFNSRERLCYSTSNIMTYERQVLTYYGILCKKGINMDFDGFYRVLGKLSNVFGDWISNLVSSDELNSFVLQVAKLVGVNLQVNSNAFKNWKFVGLVLSMLRQGKLYDFSCFDFRVHNWLQHSLRGYVREGFNRFSSLSMDGKNNNRGNLDSFEDVYSSEDFSCVISKSGPTGVGRSEPLSSELIRFHNNTGNQDLTLLELREDKLDYAELFNMSNNRKYMEVFPNIDVMMMSVYGDTLPSQGRNYKKLAFDAYNYCLAWWKDSYCEKIVKDLTLVNSRFLPTRVSTSSPYVVDEYLLVSRSIGNLSMLPVIDFSKDSWLKLVLDPNWLLNYYSMFSRIGSFWNFDDNGGLNFVIIGNDRYYYSNSRSSEDSKSLSELLNELDSYEVCDRVENLEGGVLKVNDKYYYVSPRLLSQYDSTGFLDVDSSGNNIDYVTKIKNGVLVLDSVRRRRRDLLDLDDSVISSIKVVPSHVRASFKGGSLPNSVPLLEAYSLEFKNITDILS